MQAHISTGSVFNIPHYSTLVNKQVVTNSYRKETSVMFYEKFLRLCQERGVSPTTACMDMHISDGAWRRWREGASPRGATLSKVCGYFGVTPGSMLNDSEDIVYIDQCEDVRQIVFENQEQRILFDASKGASKEAMLAAASLLWRMKGEDK